MAPLTPADIGNTPATDGPDVMPDVAENPADVSPSAGKARRGLSHLLAARRDAMAERLAQTAVGRWYHALSLTGRIGLGFGMALSAVVVLAVLGFLYLGAVTLAVDGFSRRLDFSQTAADVDILMRRLEIAMRDQLAEGDTDSVEEARGLRGELTRKLDQLGAATSGGDRRELAAVEDARKALAAYWDGLERIVVIKRERADLLNHALPDAAAQAKAGLEGLKPVGGVDSTTFANAAIVALGSAQEHALLFVERRDMLEGEKVRAILAAIGDRLQEMNRYLWVAGTREHMTAVSSALATMSEVFDDIDKLLVEEDARRADVLVPNAALISDKAGELRRSGDEAANRLRGELTRRTLAFGEIALWIGGGVLLVSLLAAWLLTRSVVRPVRVMSETLHALAVGRTDVTFPQPRHDDEIARMAGALVAVASATGEMTTALRQTQAENSSLSQRLRQVQTTDSAKSDFLVNMGQHMHGPLQQMVEQAQTLMTELHRHGVVELANDAEVLQWTGERLLSQLDAILDYARIEAGQMELCLQDFDIPRLVVEVRERNMTQADLHGNMLTATVPADLGSMHSDFARVRQALMALVDNGCKFTDNGEVTLTAEKQERDGRSWVVFTVTDNGPGFAPQAAAQLFRPFGRGSSDRTAGGKGAVAKASVRSEGAGLGLTLVAHCAALLGGEVELASSPGKGARFALLLPTVYQSEDAGRQLRVRAGEFGGQLGAPLALLEASA